MRGGRASPSVQARQIPREGSLSSLLVSNRCIDDNVHSIMQLLPVVSLGLGIWKVFLRLEMHERFTGLLCLCCAAQVPGAKRGNSLANWYGNYSNRSHPVNIIGPPSPTTAAPEQVEQRPQEAHPQHSYYAHCTFLHGAHEWAEPSSCLSC